MSKLLTGEHFLVAATFEDEGSKAIDQALADGWTVAGITSSSNSGGVWAMLVAPHVVEDEG